MSKEWDYRVIKREIHYPSDDNSVPETYEMYSIQEVYYDEDGKPAAHSIDLQVEQDTITGMRTQLEQMLKALDDDVLDEIELEEDHFYDEMNELEDMVEDTPNDMELGSKVRNWIKLGTDGRGNAIYASNEDKKDIEVVQQSMGDEVI